MSGQDFTSLSLPECQERSVLCSAKGWSTCLSFQPSIKEMMISLPSSNFLIMCNLSNLGQIPSFCINADLSRSCTVRTDEEVPRVRSYLLPLGQQGRMLPSPTGEQGCMFVALGSGGVGSQKSLSSQFTWMSKDTRESKDASQRVSFLGAVGIRIYRCNVPSPTPTRNVQIQLLC